MLEKSRRKSSGVTVEVIFRLWYNMQWYFSFPLFIFKNNILEMPSDTEGCIFVSVILKAC
jgi:hypothetical protein